MSYAELHAKTNFSFLQGASHPDELVQRAAALGYGALAVTDRNSLAGVVRAHVAAREAGLKLLIGAEITPEDAPPVVLWATDRASYGRLARLITRGRRRAEKGQCRLRFEDVAAHAEGQLAGVVPNLEARRAVVRRVQEYRAVFGDRCYLLAELHRGPDDRRRLEQLDELARRTRVPLVAAGDVHYHCADRRSLHDVLTAIRHGVTVSEAAPHLFPNAQRHLRTVEEIQQTFARLPEAVRRTEEVAERVRFSLDELRYEYPEELVPRGQTPIGYLAQLAWAGARRRYPRGVPRKVQQLLHHELALIEELRYEAYFLTVWDLVRFARRRGILCQGRGSAANSAVCYCLGITAVDPERMDVLFERFVSRERNEAPDIDVDFEHQRREEVLQYIYDKYGRERAGMTAEVITYRPRSAVRDVGKALGFSLDRVDRVAKGIEHFEDEPELAQRCREAGIDPESTTGRQLVYLVNQLVGFPRHLSQHTGGMVITGGALCELVPIENAAMKGRTVIQWNKDDLDELGILKVDCLALGMLTAIHRCFDLVEKHHGRRWTLATVPPEDPRVYAMIRRADTMGVFQIESRAQMSMLPRLRPRRFYDLVIEVAIVRPGPIQGNMVHPYLRRRNGQEPVTYPNDAVRQVLEKTLGVPLFQEQAMRLAVVAAGFTPGEADQLRRAMGAWRRPGLIDQFRRKLIDGMLARGMSREYAEAIFRQIRGFGDYGFPESHAASFALLVYVSAWLKHHYQAAFTAALLNSQPMGFYAPAQLVRDARRHGVQVRPVDVNFSHWETTLETEPQPAGRHSHGQPAIRLGLHMLQGFRQDHGGWIVEARRDGPFRSLDDFTRRTRLGRAVTSRLARAGAFASLGLDRRQALWDALAQSTERLPLFDQSPGCGEGAGGGEMRQGVPRRSGRTTVNMLPRMSPAEEMLADYRSTGLSLKAHPMQFLRRQLESQGVVPAARLSRIPNGRPVRVAGIVLVRQRPGTAGGITFVTLEDETGQANLIVRPDVWR
ncbi:MAG TPA: error-prone DNA polymerase, partial [Planctomycetes bacterium]|nr:error-prone DNA polymerase [Planctomycetota bacterium]